MHSANKIGGDSENNPKEIQGGLSLRAKFIAEKIYALRKRRKKLNFQIDFKSIPMSQQKKH